MNKFLDRNARGLLPLVFAALVATTGQAQTATTNADSDSSNPNIVKLEKFEVTGSNIPMAAEQLAVPVTVFSRNQIDASGEATSTLDLLRKIAPSISGIGSENATINTAQTYGGSELNVHGLAALVLLNGHRFASSAAEAVGGDRFADLNMIPLGAVDHVEVLQDGASAIYGSDAVGGVINVILKKNYNSWEAMAHYGRSTNNGHYSERRFDLTGGVSNGTTSITVSAEYTQHDPVMFSQRPYTNPYYANDYIPGVIDVYNNATGLDEIYTLNPKLTAPPGGAKFSIEDLVAQGVYIDQGDANDPATDAKVIPAIFNFATGQTLISTLKRKSFVLNAEHKVFGENLVAFGDLLYSNTLTRTQLNAQPIYPYVSDPYTDAMNYVSTPPPPGVQYLPVSAPINPFSSAWMDQAGDFNPDTNPSGSGLIVTAHGRFIDFPRIFQNDSTLVSATGGLRGKFAENYEWVLDGTLSRYDLNYTNDNLLNAKEFYAALANGTLNPFATKQDPSVLPGRILGSAWMKGISTENQGRALVRGTPFELPGGSIGFAVGAWYTREVLNAQADIDTQTKGWINSPSILPVNKSRYTDSYFAEVEIPIFGQANSLVGVRTLNLDLAGRYDKYQQVGSSKVPKVALKYVPFNDDLSFRFSAGKSFIAPTLYELYGPVNVGSSSSINYTPLGTTVPLQKVQFQAQTGANLNLQPSTATTWSAGFGWTPRQIRGLSVTFDFFATHQVGIPATPNQQTIIQSVEDLGTASPYVDFVHFGSVDGPKPTAPGQISTRNKNTIWIVAPISNTGGEFIRGFDATVEYAIPTASFGKFDLRSTATVFNTFQLSEMEGLPYYSYTGTASQNFLTVSRWKTFSTFEWSLKGLRFTLDHFYVPSVYDIGAGGAGASAPEHVSSYQQYDVSLAYSFSRYENKALSGLTLRIGAANVFNKMPPTAVNAVPDTNADVGYYGGAVGRMLYTEASYKF